MAAGAGPEITREHTAALEAIIDSQGILDAPDDPETTQRTDADPNNHAETEEETDETPVLDPQTEDDEPPMAAETEDGESETDTEQEGGQSADDGDGYITSISQLAEALDAEEDDVLGSIEIDNGLGAPIPLGQVIESWRDTTVNLAAQEEQREQKFATQLSELNKRTDEKLTEMAGITQALIAEMNSEFQNVDIEALKISDPERAIGLIEKQQRVRDLVAKAAHQLNLEGNERQKQSAEDLRRLHVQQATLLAQKMPHWAKKPELVQEVVAENKAMMKGLGFSDQEIEGVMDHREIIILHWAAQYRKSLKGAKSKALTQLEKNKPGLRRPGLAARATTRTDSPDPAVAQRTKRQAKFRKSGSVEDAAGVLETMFK